MAMWLPDAALLNGSPEQNQSILIAQFWHELLSPSSPDTFRARALDLPLLMRELLHIGEYAQQEPKWISHIHLICEEIESHIALNSSVLCDSPVSDTALLSISRFRGGVGDLPRLLEQARIFLDLSENHVTRLLREAEKFAPDSGNKKLLHSAMSGLATNVQARGAGFESIKRVENSLCSRPPLDVIHSLCGDAGGKDVDYTCFIAIAAPRAIASSLFSDDTFKECGVGRFSIDPVAHEWYAARPEGIVVEISGNAPSVQKSAELALIQVFHLIHLHTLYANNSNVYACPGVLVFDGAKFAVAEVTPSRHFGLEPRRGSVALARVRYGKLRDRLSGRLGNLLESHALAVSANDARSAVFHLWTALETLASSHGSEGIGQRVANAVAPIVAWRRIDKIVTYLAISVHGLRVHSGTKFDLSHMPRSTEKHIERGDLLACLAGRENNPGILSIFESCKSSPLLMYRIFRAWQELSNPKELRKALELSHSRIKWQMMRFYRTRNLLVHYGELDDLALRLLENAQYYLSTCVGRVLHDLYMHENWSINASLEFHRLRFDSLLNKMRNSRPGIRVGEILLHTKSPDSDRLVWDGD